MLKCCNVFCITHFSLKPNATCKRAYMLHVHTSSVGYKVSKDSYDRVYFILSGISRYLRIIIKYITMTKFNAFSKINEMFHKINAQHLAVHLLSSVNSHQVQLFRVVVVLIYASSHNEDQNMQTIQCHCNLWEWYIDIIAGSLPCSDVVAVRFSRSRIEASIVKTMQWYVQYTAT